MASGFRTALGIDEPSDYVRSSIARTNIEVLSYLTIFITIVAAAVFASTYFPMPPWVEKSVEMVTCYRIGMLIIAIVCLAYRAGSRALLRAGRQALSHANVVILSFACLVLAVAIWLSTIDYANTYSFFVYVAALVLLFGLLYVQPLYTITILLVCTVASIALLYSFGLHSFVLRMTLYAYALVVIVVSSSMFHGKRRAEEASEQVVTVSQHDSLTRTKNRRALTDDSDTIVGTHIHLLLCDIDDFKFFNDAFGHEAGDRILCAFADHLTAHFGESNVYRYGGDEFVAVVQGMQDEEFTTKVEAWHESFATVEYDGEDYNPTISGGYVSGTPHSLDELHDMLRLADIRLYDAKLAGRNCLLGAVFDEENRAAMAANVAKMRERRSGDSDPLTGLPSMMYFSVHAKTLLDSQALANAQFHLVYFNIENMKVYNERFGMAHGDELLVFVARSIEQAFEHALLTRIGDDRFALLTYDEDCPPGITQVHDAVSAFNPDSRTSVRAGVYAYERGVPISTACDWAKLACDHIKGRYDVYCYTYDETLHKSRERKQFILDRFSDALEQGYIEAHYQPIVRVIGGGVSEYEALARWIDPQDGFISPGDFISVLEEFRLVHLLDLRIVECVCRDFRTLQDEGYPLLPVNVNLSRYDLELCDIVGEIDALMQRYGIEHSMINIEITESAFSNNNELLRSTIERFHELGMQVWMDDFGSGYSSLNVLREFDFDVIKFDMRFLRHRDEGSKDRSRTMIPHIVNMAKELGLQTLAEGVEDMEQFEFLKSVGCEKVQGFAFDRPAPLEHVREVFDDKALSVEHLSERSYYDPVGQVNLGRPMAIDPELARDIEMSSGLPAAVVEFRAGTVRYLQWNASYLDYLVDIGMESIENSEKQMNDMSRPQSQGFFQAAGNLRGKAKWLNLTFYEGEDLCTGMARCVSVDDEHDAVAFVYIAFNLTRYLSRTGLSIPKDV